MTTTKPTTETMLLAGDLRSAGLYVTFNDEGCAVVSNPRLDKRGVGMSRVVDALEAAGIDEGMYDARYERDILGRLRVVIWAEVG